MSATDELRKLLDGRGIEHEDKHTELVPDISDWDSTWWQGIAGMTFLAIEDKTCGREGCVYINGTHLTPEQAIVATLGSHERTTKMYRDEHGIWHCAACERGADVITGNDGELDSWIDSWAPNYCPYCGRRGEQ